MRMVITVIMQIIVLSLTSCGSHRNETHHIDHSQTYSLHAKEMRKLSNRLSIINRATKHSFPVFYHDKVIVLMYHNVEIQSKHANMITLEQLNEQLSAIKMNGFHMITMDQYLDFIMLDKKVPDNAVLLTFDDGYGTFYKNVYPLLRKLGVTATNFIVVSTIDDQKHKGRTKLTWQQMREMKKAGMSFYNHTYNSHAYMTIDFNGIRRRIPVLSHPIFLKSVNRLETTREYERRVHYDLAIAEKRLKTELKNSRSALAFPYGAYNDTILQIVHKLGIETTFTIRPGINGHEQHNGFRINAGNQNLKTSDLIEMLKTSSSWSPPTWTKNP